MHRRGQRVNLASRAGTKREHATVENSPKTQAAPERRRGGHSQSSFEEDFPRLPTTPSKSPASKKMASELREMVNPSLLSEMHAQFEALKALINSRSDSLESKIVAIEGKIERVSAELSATNAKTVQLEQQITRLEKEVKMAHVKVDAMETQSRRFNLRLIGLPEANQEVIRAEIIKICQHVAPGLKEKMHENIDIVHRLGRRRPPGEGSRPRPVIMRFAKRLYRDEVWSAAKTSTYLTDRDLQFKEDFSKGDRERRAKLFPEVKRLRDEGKIVFYSGARAFIQGEGEVFLNE